MLDLPSDNPKRKQLDPLIQLISQAARLAAFNKALGTNVTSLDTFPVDFVEVVIGWGNWKPDAR